MTHPLLRPLNREALRREFREASPFPFVAIDGFLEPDFAREVARSYPGYFDACRDNQEFSALNEKKKVQINDSTRFPEPVKKLNEILSSPEFLADLEHITGIDDLVTDTYLKGGGMHLTGPRGRLDVHVDFNYVEERQLHRRLNLLLYLNETWRDRWGGALELWDEDVKRCVHVAKPTLNRCIVFATSDISFHGVEPVTCPPDTRRISFAAYYYTREAPAGWDGMKHTTVFRARPQERIRGHVLMPLQKARRRLVPTAKRMVKKAIRRS